VRVPRGDRGAGSVLAVALIAGVLSLTVMLVPLYSVFATKQALAGAADAAALAAADVRVGLEPGEPCAVAARVASANGGRLSSCHVDGLVVTVRVTATVAGFAVGVAATAGPPDIRAPTGVE
jgi:secretion/DNA translocation related TadE-like protein